MPGVTSALSDVIDSVQQVFSSVLNQIIIAAIIILVGFIAGRMLGKLVRNLLHEVALDKLGNTVGIKVSLEELLGHVVTYAVYFVAVVMALDKLGLDTFVFNILAGGVIAIVLLSVLLAIKDLIPNMFAGFFLRQRGIVKEGDRISVDDIDGKVVKVDIMEVKLETKKGDTIFIPNSLMLKKKIIKKKR